MTPILLVVDQPDHWPLELPDVRVISAREYLLAPSYARVRRARVFNLCRSYRYQTLGYYVSLLAEARGHRVLPRVATIQDLKLPAILRLASNGLETLANKALTPLQSTRFTLSIYFGRNLARRYDALSRQLFDLFPAPMLRAEFVRNEGTWMLRHLQPIALREVPDEHRAFLHESAQDFFARRHHVGSTSTRSRYELAILTQPDDPLPPSDERALRLFTRAAQRQRLSVEFIHKEDYGRLGTFDGLFIRETTAVNHHTYRFARRAEVEGLVVIDDPESIIRCANKVFLAEALERAGIPALPTMVVHPGNLREVVGRVGLPCVLKAPDASFSLGVVRADNATELRQRASALLEKSDLVIAQAYAPTAFDWRIGVLNHEPLYACRYYMARNHWQIYNHSEPGEDRVGEVDTVALEEVPADIIRSALAAARLIGNGLYGIDLKHVDRRARVVEINDNPSIDAGIEDAQAGAALYDRIITYFAQQLDARTAAPADHA